MHLPRNSFIKNILVFIIAATGLAGCGSSQQLSPSGKLSAETTQATLWVQHAAEYDAITTGAYQAAVRRLPALLADSSVTAVTEQVKKYKSLPPAVILDVDETVLDNSPYQARMIRQHKTFDLEAWTRWVREAQAKPIAGALEFTQYAADHGVSVFYVTNRSHQVEAATYKNLKAAGFPLVEGKDMILTKGERDDWTSDKSTRRAYVAKNYRVIMQFGDNLNDFVDTSGRSEHERDRVIQQYEDYWGNRWFALPNPNYGSWEQALYGKEKNLDAEHKLKIKSDKLETKEQPVSSEQ